MTLESHKMPIETQHFNQPREETFCLINSELIQYDGRSTKDLETAKAYYSGWDYIGSSSVFYVGGIRNEYPGLIHFFKKPI